MSEQKQKQKKKRRVCPYCERVDFKSHGQYAGHISAHIRSQVSKREGLQDNKQKRAKLLSILDNALKDTLKEKPMDALGVLSAMSGLPQERQDKITAILDFFSPKRDETMIKVSVRWFDGYLEKFEAEDVRFSSDLLWMRLKNGENRHIPTRQVRWWSMYPESHERSV